MQVLGMFTNAGQAIRPWRGSWALFKVYWEAVFIYPLLKLFMDACLSRELQMGSNAEFSFSPKTAFLDIKQWTLWAEALRKGKWKLFISRSSSSLKPGLCVLGFFGMFQKLELNSKLLNIGHPFGFRQLWLTLMTRRWVWIWNLGAYMIDFEQCLSALGLPPPFVENVHLREVLLWTHRLWWSLLSPKLHCGEVKSTMVAHDSKNVNGTTSGNPCGLWVKTVVIKVGILEQHQYQLGIC